jgi:hypothetical protein
MHRRILLSTIATVVTCAIAPSVHGQDLETRFGLLRVGDSSETVLSVMGKPSSTSEGTTLGVPNSQFRWRVGERTYAVGLIAGRLVSKRICHATVDC